MKTLRIRVYDYIDAEVEDDVTLEEVYQKLDVDSELYRLERNMKCDFEEAHLMVDKDEDGNWDVDIIEE